jgi:hypothetical protein
MSVEKPLSPLPMSLETRIFNRPRTSALVTLIMLCSLEFYDQSITEQEANMANNAARETFVPSDHVACLLRIACWTT